MFLFSIEWSIVFGFAFCIETEDEPNESKKKQLQPNKYHVIKLGVIAYP